MRAVAKRCANSALLIHTFAGNFLTNRLERPLPQTLTPKARSTPRAGFPAGTPWRWHGLVLRALRPAGDLWVELRRHSGDLDLSSFLILVEATACPPAFASGPLVHRGIHVAYAIERARHAKALTACLLPDASRNSGEFGSGGRLGADLGPHAAALRDNVQYRDPKETRPPAPNHRRPPWAKRERLAVKSAKAGNDRAHSIDPFPQDSINRRTREPSSA